MNDSEARGVFSIHSLFLSLCDHLLHSYPHFFFIIAMGVAFGVYQMCPPCLRLCLPGLLFFIKWVWLVLEALPGARLLQHPPGGPHI